MFGASMNLPRIHRESIYLSLKIPKTPPFFSNCKKSISTSISHTRHFCKLHISPLPASRQSFNLRVASSSPAFWTGEDGEGSELEGGKQEDREVVYKETLRLVECAMLAAVSGLTYFLSNSLAIENYFGCFFALPIVVTSMRWGVAAGRKTMVATGMLLLVLAGPVKALTYMLMHGFVGFTMGSLWRLGTNWTLSIFITTLVRALGAVGYVLVTSFLIRENILALITINIHASLAYIFTSIGVNMIPSMNVIYALFGTLVLLNCGFFIFLLHILYAILLTKLGMRASFTLPRWLERAM
uniref:DUF2232 domain-containing protein n=1 Tax=Kalanchoe fedtschenkoi TaxID=63787 RepID=A0A7N0TTF7_KALFE